MRAAVVNSDSLIIVNIIVADANIDAPSEGCYLLNIPDDSPLAIGDNINSIPNEPA